MDGFPRIIFCDTVDGSEILPYVGSILKKHEKY